MHPFCWGKSDLVWFLLSFYQQHTGIFQGFISVYLYNLGKFWESQFIAQKAELLKKNPSVNLLLWLSAFPCSGCLFMLVNLNFLEVTWLSYVRINFLFNIGLVVKCDRLHLVVTSFTPNAKLGLHSISMSFLTMGHACFTCAARWSWWSVHSVFT